MRRYGKWMSLAAALAGAVMLAGGDCDFDIEGDDDDGFGVDIDDDGVDIDDKSANLSMPSAEQLMASIQLFDASRA